jgi:hypothetical protein
MYPYYKTGLNGSPQKDGSSHFDWTAGGFLCYETTKLRSAISSFESCPEQQVCRNQAQSEGGEEVRTLHGASRPTQGETSSQSMSTNPFTIERIKEGSHELERYFQQQTDVGAGSGKNRPVG